MLSRRFWRWVRKRTHPKDLLCTKKVAVLGLGDTNYDKFCYAAKTLHKRFLELGAVEFYRAGFADEAIGLDTVVEPWISGLWKALAAELPAGGGSSTNGASSSSVSVAARATPETQKAASNGIGHGNGNGVGGSTDGIASGSTEAPGIALDDGTNSNSAMGLLRHLSLHKAQLLEEQREKRRKSSEDGSCLPISSPSSASASASLRIRAPSPELLLGPATNTTTANNNNNAVSASNNASAAAVTVAPPPRLSIPPILQAQPLAAGGGQPTLHQPAAISTTTSAPLLPFGVRSFQELFPGEYARAKALTAAEQETGEVTPLEKLPEAITKGLPKPPAKVWNVSLHASKDALLLSFLASINANASAASTITATAAHNDAFPLGSSSTSAAAAPTPLPAPSSSSSSSATSSAPTPPRSSPSASSASSPSHGVASSSSGTGTGTSSSGSGNGNGVGGSPPASSVGAVGAVAGGAPSAEEALRGALHNPTTARITAARYLTNGGPSAQRRVIQAEVDVRGTALQGAWTPGDSIGVLAPNDDALAEGMVTRALGPASQSVVLQIEAVTSSSSSSSSSTSLAASSGADTPRSVSSTGGSSANGTVGGSTTAAIAAANTVARFVPAWLSRQHGLPFDCVPAVDLFRWCLDLTSAPKKALVRAFADSAKGADRVCLLMLCGRGGKSFWETFIDTQRLTILELLLLFPSCKPDLGLLVSALPTLQPRYYSLACSALANPFKMSVAFTVVHYECGVNIGPDTPTAAVGTTPSIVAEAKHHAQAAAEAKAEDASVAESLPATSVPSSSSSSSSSSSDSNRITRSTRIHRKGLATTYLERLCAGLLHASASAAGSDGPCSSGAESGSAGIMSGGGMNGNGDLCFSQCPKIMTFMRPNRHFNVPASPETPFIMIGPGTGVAPFIGFLQHRRARVLADEVAAVAVCRGWWRSGVHISSLRDDNNAPPHYGATWLFFGNRHPDVDFLFRDELSEYLGNGSLSRLYTAFSREGPEKLYVQHRMKEEGKPLADLIVDGNASIFVCGDGMQMAKDVHETLVDLLLTHKAGSHFPNGRSDVEAMLQQMTKMDRYCRDVWS